jgi:NAD(P)-dependent dehydrogenase (short-subunit alcohol dehydrogenase family)
MLIYGGPPFLLTYCASKAALVAFAKGTANTVKRDGIRVFGINLSRTWNPAEQEAQTRIHGLPQNWSETLGAKQPFGLLLMPEGPAALIAFLVSPGAGIMTGVIIDHDEYVAGTVDDNPGA